MSYIPLLIAAIVAAIVCLGTAEIIMLIAKIAFHTERSADALCSQNLSQVGPAQASVSATSGRTVAPAPKVSPVPTGFKLPAAKYFYLQDNEVQGPATVADIKNMIAMGLLPKDAQVAKEGTENWMPISAASVV